MKSVAKGGRDTVDSFSHQIIPHHRPQTKFTFADGLMFLGFLLTLATIMRVLLAD